MANTTAPLSETAVANMAATTLSERHITSLDDPSSFARFVAAEFGFMRDEFLAMYPWAFATEYAALAADPVAPISRWAYRYKLPSDCLRVRKISCSNTFNGRAVPYERAKRYLLTDAAAPLYIRYTQRLPDLTEWDVLAARALAQYIAMAAAHRVTGKNTYVEKATQAFDRSMWQAQHHDALDLGTPEDAETDDAPVLDVRSSW